MWWKSLLGRINIGQKWGGEMPQTSDNITSSSIKKLCVDCVYGDMSYHPQKLSRNVVLKLFKLRRDFFHEKKKKAKTKKQNLCLPVVSISPGWNY